MEMKPGYKKTEVGVIPDDWSLDRLGNVVTFLDGKRRPVKDTDRAKMSGTIPYYGASGIVDYVNDYIFDEDLILLGEDGENILSRNTRLAFRISGKTWVNNHAHVLRTNKGNNITFVTEYLESLNYERFNSGTAQPKLNKQTCYSILIALPPTTAEQEAIAEVLSDADAFIESLEQLIAKKRQVKQGAMQELLTGKKRLSGFDTKWGNFSFDELFTPLRNASISRSEFGEHKAVACVHYGDIHTHSGEFLIPATKKTNVSRDQVRTLPRLAVGDLLMADASEDTAAIGKAVEILDLGGCEAVAGLHTMALRGDKTKLADGFKGYLQYLPEVRKALIHLATGVSVYGITKSGVKAIEVNIPEPNEQVEISRILSDLNAEIDAIDSKLAKARQIKQGMMQELLTGRIRLI
jgi:type I restriction enzyme S subunit